METEEKKSYVNIIHKNSKHTLQLLENLLIWARSERGETSAYPEKIDIAKEIHECLLSIRSLAEEKNISLKLPDKEKSANALADLNMFSTIIRNLVTNAIKFTYPDGNVTVTCRQDEHNTIISVEDNGTGMKPEQLENIWKIDKIKSFRGTKGEKGTGLGLLICKEFAEKNNGTLEVQSEFGSGTTFILTLPGGMDKSD